LVPAGKGAGIGLGALLRDLEAGRVRPAYLAVGEEGGIRARVRRALEGLVPEEAQGMDSQALDAGAADVDWSVVAAATRTFPWTSPYRLVLVDHVDQLGGKAEDIEGGGEDLLRYLADPSDRAVLGRLGGKVDTRQKMWKELSKLCTKVICNPLRDDQARDEARRLFKQFGVRPGEGVPELVVEKTGSDLARLESEVEKLCLLAGEGGALDVEAVEALLGRSRERAVWDFTDALARRDRAGALRVLGEMLEDGASEHYLVAMAAWSTRRLLTGKAMVERGASPGDAAREVRAWGAGERAFLSGLRAWDRARLCSTLRRLAALDRELKSSALPARLLLERFVLESTD